MTNETEIAVNATTNVVSTTANAVSAICDGFGAEISKGQEFWDQIVTWLTEKGLSFAINAVAALVILLVGWVAIRALVSLVRKAVQKGNSEKALLGNFVCNITSKVCWAVLLVVVLGKLGVDVGPLVAGLGVTGFILGFAFQESLGNLASGMMIAINEPFKLGDYVIIAGLEGTVNKVDMMATVLATADNKKIVIPNKSAWGGPIVNFSALGQRRVDIKIGVDYGSDVSKAIKIALETLRTVPNVLAEPAPAVSVAEMADSSIVLNIRPWADGANYWTVYNDVHVAIKTAFEKSGINIPFPQLTVHLDK